MKKSKSVGRPRTSILKMISIRMSPGDIEIIAKRAKRNGTTFSAWLRYAGKNYKPNWDERIKVKAS